MRMNIATNKAWWKNHALLLPLLLLLLVGNDHDCVVIAFPVLEASSSVPTTTTTVGQQQETTTDFWKTRKNAAIVATAATISLSVVATLPAANAAVMVTNPSTYTNDYADPLHPQCKRHIEVSRDGKTFRYTGTAVGPKDDPVLRGCSREEIREYGIRRGSFDGMILDDGSNKISAGDGIHEGVWEPANSVSVSSSKNNNLKYTDVDGIRWNDGNKWIVVQEKNNLLQPGFGYFFLTFYIGVSILAGIKEFAQRAKNAIIKKE